MRNGGSREGEGVSEERSVTVLSGGPSPLKREGADELDAVSDALLRAITRLVWLEHKEFTSELARYSLTLPQYVTLVQLHDCGTGVPMGQLAECMRQSSATMTGIVDRLVRMKLAERRRDDSDRRVVRVVATSSGQQVVADAHRASYQRTIHIVGRLGPAERKDLENLLCQYLAAAEGLFNGST